MKRHILKRISKISISKSTPQARSGHLFNIRGVWTRGQTPTSIFSTRVTLGQFLNCSGLPFSHLLNGEKM